MSAVTVGGAAVLCMLAGLRDSGAATGYPDRPIRFIIASSPGGTVDIIGRLVAQKLGDAVAQTVIPDNRAGAAGTLAAEITVAAAPDGYTLALLSPPPMATNVALRGSKMGYDPEKDLTHIAMTGKVPLALTVQPGFPAKTTKELIALAKRAPGSLNYGSAGTGSSNQLVGELLKIKAGIDITHVPFKGGAPALTALMANQIDIYIATVPTVAPMLAAGRVRAIAVSSAKRSPAIPDVPTIAETALPGFDLTTWYCIVGPARLPKPIVSRLNAEIGKVLDSADARERLTAAGVNVEPMTPGELSAFIHAEIQKLGMIVKASGAKID